MKKTEAQRFIERARLKIRDMILLQEVRRYMGGWYSPKSYVYTDICSHGEKAHSCCKCIYESLHFEPEDSGDFDLVDEIKMSIGHKLESAYGVNDKIMDILDRGGMELNDHLTEKDDVK